MLSVRNLGRRLGQPPEQQWLWRGVSFELEPLDHRLRLDLLRGA